MSTNENKDKKAEVTALQAISAEDRKDWISLAFVQAGICVCVPAFLLGALLAEAMPIWPAIISGSLGYLIVVVGMVATGMIGCDLGLASCTCCQAGFGKSGARFIVSTIFAVNMIGWFGIQNGVCGEAFSFKHNLGNHNASDCSIWSACARKTRQDFYSITNDHYVLRNIPSI